MVWRPFVSTTDRSMILATRDCSEGLDESRPITEEPQHAGILLNRLFVVRGADPKLQVRPHYRLSPSESDRRGCASSRLMRAAFS